MQSPHLRSWTESDGQLLRSLREAARLEASTFARACAISAAQLAELEQGGHGRFYNDRIKAHTGRNLLRRLGHVPAETTAPVEPAANTHPSIPEPMADAGPVAQAAAAPASVEPIARVAAAAPQRNPWPVRAASAVAVVATLVVILMPRTAREAPQVAAIATAQASVPAQPAAVASSAPAEPAASAAAPASAAPAASAAVAPPAASRCDMPARDQAVAYTPASALRPNNYVYIESARETSVCVVDGQNRETVAIVKPGDGASVYGTPPFLVHGRQWADLRVFYQGTRVTVDTPAPPAAVLLNAR